MYVSMIEKLYNKKQSFVSNASQISLRYMLTLLLIGGVGHSFAKEAGGNDVPVTIYTAKKIITMNADAPEASAIAVAGGKVVGVGSLASLRDSLSKVQESKKIRVDKQFSEKILVPGLIEQHVHPVLAALTLTSDVVSIEQWTLPGKTYPAARNQVEYLSLLTEANNKLDKKERLFLSWGYHQSFHGPLSRDHLDLIDSDRAIIVWHRSAHEFIMNTKAIELSGITEELLNATEPAIKSQVNLAEGHFWERGAFEFALPHITHLVMTPKRLLSGLKLANDYLHAAGVTTAAEPGGFTGEATLQAVIKVFGDESSPLRFYMIPDGRLATVADRKFSDSVLLERTEQQISGTYGHTGELEKHVKLFADGAIFSQLMQMEDGYTDGHKGEWLMEPTAFAKAFQVYWDAGYQIHIHQNGDAGLKLVIDTLAQSQRRTPRQDHRTTIVHFGFAKPNQIKQLAKLGAIVAANPYYAVALGERYAKHGLGPERAFAMTPLNSAAKEGIRFSLHSDMPMAPAQPLFLMGAAVNRVGAEGELVGADQRITAMRALRAVTIDAAYSLRLEEQIGSLEVGKLANITVLEENPLEVAPEKIANIAVWGTMLEGRIQAVPRND